ncbi:MAG: hypothetical protein JRF54_02195 [Deltaproteobacteria bacterium]|nr:hypothetical protein [Deltaproteobacteria bacterium]
MLCRLALVGTALGSIACTSLPPAPGTGTGGAADGGAGGQAGVGGEGGHAATGGTGGAAGIADCPAVQWDRTAELEDADKVVPPIGSIQFDVATGSVSVSTDTIDEWLIESCDGLHDIVLGWDLVQMDSELNLRAGELEGSTGFDSGRRLDRLAGVMLSADEPFLITVEAVDTSGVSSLGYDIKVVPLE